jgi:hypothetical protein
MSNVDKFINAFLDVKAKGEFKSNRSGNTGIGKTLEDAIGVVENNLDMPDLHGFEIKSQRALSESYVTLFTKAPTSPPKANNTLRINYGSNDVEFPDVKVLHTSCFANKWNTHISGFSYKLEVDRENQKVSLLIKRIDTEKIVENGVYWTFEVLDKIVKDKIQNLAFVQAKTRTDNGSEYFTFSSCSLYSGLTLDRFLERLEAGDIMFDIRIGAYKNPTNKKTYGKTHDHGSGFRIKKEKLKDLYNEERKV